MSRKRQKPKGMKRPRSWHHRFAGPDIAFKRAVRVLDAALRRAEEERSSQTPPGVQGPGGTPPVGGDRADLRPLLPSPGAHELHPGSRGGGRGADRSHQPPNEEESE